jgi:Surface-adhesin protein E
VILIAAIERVGVISFAVVHTDGADRRGAANLTRIHLFVPILLLIGSVSLAGTKPNPCALQQDEVAAAQYGTPAKTDALKNLEACLAIAQEQEKAEWAETRNSWAASLDKLPNGGWEFLMVSADGTYAIFGSHRHGTREGNVVAIWLRYEFRDKQIINGNVVRSRVERNLYDCAGVRSKPVSDGFYPQSNLGGEPITNTFDEAKVAWSPAIPGTVGDSLLDWACKTTTRAQPKPQ